MDRQVLGYGVKMTETPSDTNQDEYEDQDAGPTMTAPEDARPDAQVATDDEADAG